MKCPVCVEEGERSTLTVGMSSTTLMWSQPWYDEDGVYHDHDRNTRSTAYRCSNGHTWETRSKGGCPAGDFPEEREVIIREPKPNPFHLPAIPE